MWPKYRQHWKDRENLGPEAIFTCVQCNKDFLISENTEGACRFHLQPEATVVEFERTPAPVPFFGHHTSTFRPFNQRPQPPPVIHHPPKRVERKQFPCCKGSADEGCVRGTHRTKHHQDYVYGNWKSWVQALRDDELSRNLRVFSFANLVKCSC